MVVQHNMQAMNANRMLNVTTSTQSKATEKLSSGYKINRAADDAAGLTISEKMRKQIKGLDRASTNAEDGVSAVQTAEGALTEVHSMLQRMNELAVQASNGTNSESDRSAIQDEISQLTTEIDRVAETTKFNETYLLKGNTAGTSSDVKIAAHDAGLAGKLTDNGDTATFALDKALVAGDKVTIAGKEYTIGDSANKNDYDKLDTVKGAVAKGDSYIDNDGKKWNVVDDATNVADMKENDITVTNAKAALTSGIQYTSAADGTTKTITAETPSDSADLKDKLDNAAGKAVKINGVGNYTIGVTTDAANNTITSDDFYAMIKNGDKVTIDTTDYTAILGSGDKDTITAKEAYDKMAAELKNASSIGTDAAAEVKNNEDGTFTITKGSVNVKDSLSFSLHVGADADMTNKINVDIDSMSAAGLGIKGLNVKDSTGIAATYAIDAIADAVSKVSSQRSALGAVQNRLEHTIANVDNVVENTTSAESRIRDTDMAETMVEYSKNNILAQAGQSMLAQANQANQGVLSLLQ